MRPPLRGVVRTFPDWTKRRETGDMRGCCMVQATPGRVALRRERRSRFDSDTPRHSALFRNSGALQVIRPMAARKDGRNMGTPVWIGYAVEPAVLLMSVRPMEKMVVRCPLFPPGLYGSARSLWPGSRPGTTGQRKTVRKQRSLRFRQRLSGAKGGTVNLTIPWVRSTSHGGKAEVSNA